METVTVVDAAAARLPAADDSVIQFWFADSVQAMATPPVFWSIKSMLAGVNGPPATPVEASPPAGVTARAPGGAEIVKVTGRVAFPVAFVVFVNVTVALWAPVKSVFAPALIEIVTVADAAAARLPEACDTVIQVWLAVTVQSIAAVPVFWSEKSMLAGVNGPPVGPVDVSPPAGVTERAPAGGVAVSVALTVAVCPAVTVADPT